MSKVNKFVISFTTNYYPTYLLDNDSSVFTASLLVVYIGKKFSVDSIHFTDSSPEWQARELENIKGDLNLDALHDYAKLTKFSGKLIFPVILKSELTKGAIKEQDVYSIYSNVFRSKGNLLNGNVKFEEVIVITAGMVIDD